MNQGIWKPIFKFFYACENATEEAYVLHGNSGESIVRYKALQARTPAILSSVYLKGFTIKICPNTGGTRKAEKEADQQLGHGLGPKQHQVVGIEEG